MMISFFFTLFIYFFVFLLVESRPVRPVAKLLPLSFFFCFVFFNNFWQKEIGAHSPLISQSNCTLHFSRSPFGLCCQSWRTKDSINFSFPAISDWFSLANASCAPCNEFNELITICIVPIDQVFLIASEIKTVNK